MKMEIVDKITLAKSIARRLNMTITSVIEILHIYEDEIIESIKNNKKVQLNDFLTFIPKDIEGKTIISPLDNKKYEIPPKRIVEIKAGKYFKETIKNVYVKGDNEINDNN